MLVTLLTSVIGYGSFIYWFINDQHETKIRLVKTVGATISQDVVKLILLNKVSVGADISSKLKSFSDLESLVLYNRDDKPIYQYSKKDISFIPKALPPKSKRESCQKENLLRLYADSSYQDTHLGTIQATFRVDTIIDIIKKDIWLLIGILIIMFLLSYTLSTIFAKRFTQPILKVVSFLEQIIQVDSLDTRVSIDENNEYGKLYNEINTMLDRMEESAKAHKIAAIAFEIQSGMTITDADHKILQVNRAFSEITGYSSQEVIGKTPAILNSKRHSPEYYESMFKAIETHHYWSGEIYNRRKDGSVFPEHLTIQSVLDDDNKPIYYIASFIDISLQKNAEEKVRYLTKYDTLTGLCNRTLFVDIIQNHLQNKKQKNWGVLLCFDIQNFKMINDAYTHTFGDNLLLEIVQRVKSNFDDISLFGRIGGDEFVIWYSNIGEDKQKAMLKSNTIAQVLINVLSQPYIIDDKTIHAKPFAGITLYNETNKDSKTLLKEADFALHSAKESEDDQNISYFDMDIQNSQLTHLDMNTQIIESLKKNQFELYYQLQYNEDGDIFAAEALIRWNHPQKGLVYPDQFIPVAEKTGSILPMGEWIIEAGCKQLALWQQDEKTKDWKLAINISAKQFRQNDFLNNLQKSVLKYNIITKNLKLELTESVLVHDMDNIIEKMHTLRDLGFQISLDDFGTGYSSLQYLKKLPLKQIKIDQSFVRDMFNDKHDIAIIKSVLLLGESFDLEVIAEGVETKEHFEFLKELGCRFFQGYYFARPQKIDDINKLITDLAS